jgi:hypothetical protein
MRRFGDGEIGSYEKIEIEACYGNNVDYFEVIS